MLRTKIILACVLLPFVAGAQVIFNTLVSKRLVTLGESFLVQYALEDLEKDEGFITPPFNDFRVSSGPDTYSRSTDNGTRLIKNVVFTLVAIKPGRFMIQGATANVKGKLVKSNDVMIEVLTKKQADERLTAGDDNASEYFLRPDEDPYEKMKRNLFMKVMVDRNKCYVGQPVVATYKLYSRLESKSDIVKNPGFYGFTVQDIVNLNDNVSTTETIDGKTFEVHTIRCVQLYPLQAGIFNIDAMEVMNKVEFSKSASNKKTEQKIVEGVFEKAEPPARTNTITCENTISTDKITIHVKPYPAAKRPSTFTGATGKFSIRASLEKNELANNQQGKLVVVIEGKGNFTQLSAPVIQWPEGIESFEAITKDSLDKTQTPLKGSKTFLFPFVTNKPGNYQIPTISYTFFDPDTNNYRTVSAAVPQIDVSNEQFKVKPELNHQHIVKSPESRDHSSAWIYGGIAFVVLLIIILELKRPAKQEIVSREAPEKIETQLSIEQLLQPAQFSLVADDGRFYGLLQQTIWEQLAPALQLSAGTMNKHALYRALKERNTSEEQSREILYILQECETAVFTKAELAHDNQDLLDRTRIVLEKIRDQLA